MEDVIQQSSGAGRGSSGASSEGGQDTWAAEIRRAGWDRHPPFIRLLRAEPPASGGRACCSWAKKSARAGARRATGHPGRVTPSGVAGSGAGLQFISGPHWQGRADGAMRCLPLPQQAPAACPPSRCLMDLRKEESMTAADTGACEDSEPLPHSCPNWSPSCRHKYPIAIQYNVNLDFPSENVILQLPPPAALHLCVSCSALFVQYSRGWATSDQLVSLSLRPFNPSPTKATFLPLSHQPSCGKGEPMGFLWGLLGLAKSKCPFRPHPTPPARASNATQLSKAPKTFFLPGDRF